MPRPSSPSRMLLAGLLSGNGIGQVVYYLRRPMRYPDPLAAIMSKWPILGLVDAKSLLRLAVDAIGAAASHERLAANEPQPLTEVPVNPYLYGPEPGGYRVRYMARVTGGLPSAGRREPLVVVDSDVELSIDDIRNAIMDQIDEAAPPTPEYTVTGGTGGDSGPVVFFLEWEVRRF